MEYDLKGKQDIQKESTISQFKFESKISKHPLWDSSGRNSLCCLFRRFEIYFVDIVSCKNMLELVRINPSGKLYKKETLSIKNSFFAWFG